MAAATTPKRLPTKSYWNYAQLLQDVDLFAYGRKT